LLGGQILMKFGMLNPDIFGIFITVPSTRMTSFWKCVCLNVCLKQLMKKTYFHVFILDIYLN